MNEYHILWIICIGALAHSAHCLRSWREALFACVLAVLSVAAPWLWLEPSERAFAIPVLWFVTYGILFPLVFHERLAPRISPAGVIHHVIAASWAIAEAWPTWDVPMPTWFASLLLASPIVLAVVVAAGGAQRYAFRVTLYLAFLLSFLVFACTANPLDAIVDLFRAYGFSLWLAVGSFLTGATLLIVLGVIIQIMFAFAPTGGALWSGLFKAILGETYDVEQRRRFASLIHGAKIDAVGWALLFLHAGIAIVAYKLEIATSTTAVVTSVIAWFWLLEEWERRRVI